MVTTPDISNCNICVDFQSTTRIWQLREEGGYIHTPHTPAQRVTTTLWTVCAVVGDITVSATFLLHHQATIRLLFASVFVLSLFGALFHREWASGLG